VTESSVGGSKEHICVVLVTVYDEQDPDIDGCQADIAVNTDTDKHYYEHTILALDSISDNSNVAPTRSYTYLGFDDDGHQELTVGDKIRLTGGPSPSTDPITHQIRFVFSVVTKLTMCWLLVVVCCVLCVVCCLLFVVCCLLFVVCCLLFVILCCVALCCVVWCILVCFRGGCGGGLVM